MAAEIRIPKFKPSYTKVSTRNTQDTTITLTVVTTLFMHILHTVFLHAYTTYKFDQLINK